MTHKNARNAVALAAVLNVAFGVLSVSVANLLLGAALAVIVVLFWSEE